MNQMRGFLVVGRTIFISVVFRRQIIAMTTNRSDEPTHWLRNSKTIYRSAANCSWNHPWHP